MPPNFFSCRENLDQSCRALELVQFESSSKRRRRSLVPAQWLERSDNPGNANDKRLNPEGVRQFANPFRVGTKYVTRTPGLSLRSNHWAGTSERLRRFQTEPVPSHWTILSLIYSERYTS